jgi:DNA-binding GntR family transcriptional regulator
MLTGGFMGRRGARVSKSVVAIDSRTPGHRAGARPETASISLRRNTISTQIHGVLRRDIVVGRLAPRATLSEQEIAARFGISRTPVREAMIKLAEEGLVEIFPQYGSFVAPIKLPDVFDSQFAREALESAAVAKAIERLDARWDQELQAVIARQKSLVRPQDRDAFFGADEDMHMLIMRIAGHADAWRFVESAKAQMDRVRHIAILLPRKQASILAEHEAVIDRMLARDTVGAVEAMRSHLRGIFRTIEMLRNQNNEYFADGQDDETRQKATTAAPRQTRKYLSSNSTTRT